MPGVDVWCPQVAFVHGWGRFVDAEEIPGETFPEKLGDVSKMCTKKRLQNVF